MNVSGRISEKLKERERERPHIEKHKSIIDLFDLRKYNKIQKKTKGEGAETIRGGRVKFEVKQEKKEKIEKKNIFFLS